MIAQVVRKLNALNPTTYGRLKLSEVPRRLGADPADGIYRVAPGVVMDLHLSESIEWAIYYNAFEILCTRAILSRLGPGSVFLDIGANVGYYSLMAHRRVGPGGRVLSFEPNPPTLAKLRRNIALSGAEGIEVFDVALSDRDEEVSIFCPTDAAQHSHGEASLRRQGWSDYDRAEVHATRLDDALPGDLDRLDFVKIDVEGAELLAFRGAEKTIKRFRPVILMELNQAASRSFGHDTLEAVELLLSYHPDYRLRFMARHSGRWVGRGELKDGNIRDGNMLLC
jgi:FkbM family methyltransferase